MSFFLLYFAKSFFIGAVLFAFYIIFLKDKKHHTFNRFFLLFIFPAGILLPLIHFNLYQLQIPYSIDKEIPDAGGWAWLEFIGAMLYITIVFVLIASLLLKTYRIFNLVKKASARNIAGIRFIETDDERAPFSFFNTIFWKIGMDLQSVNGKKIFQHESLHIAQKHSYDKLLCQTLCCVFWMNPFFWCAQKELGIVHEFLADEDLFLPGDSAAFANMLLSSYDGGRYLGPGIGFNKSDIGRRLSMINFPRKHHSIWKLSFATVFLFLSITAIVSGNFYSIHRSTQSSDQQQKMEEMEQKLKAERNNLRPAPP